MGHHATGTVFWGYDLGWMRPAPELIEFINVLRPADRQIALTDVTNGGVADSLRGESAASA